MDLRDDLLPMQFIYRTLFKTNEMFCDALITKWGQLADQEECERKLKQIYLLKPDILLRTQAACISIDLCAQEMLASHSP
jgi:hypothetical protein